MQISIINKNELENEFTIGAEFYQPYYVQKVDAIKNKGNFDLLGNLCELITDGDHSTTQYTDEGVLYLLSESIQEGYIDTSVRRYISRDLHNSLKRSQLVPRNVVLTKTGVYFGKSAVIPDSFPAANTSAHVGKFLVKEKILNPYYLSTFFNCEYGYSQLRRRGVKASRPEMKLVEFSDLKVFIAEQNFQQAIEKTVKKSNIFLHRSTNLFGNSQELLLSELGLINWNSKHRLNFVKNYSDIAQAQRLDAKFFEPKYDEILAHIKATGQSVALGTLLSKVQRGKQPVYAETGLPVINSKHVANGEARVDADNRLATREARNITIQCGDVLINGTGVGTIGRCAPYLRNHEALPDNHVTILRPSDESIDPVYLSVFLNSIAGQSQVEQWFRGSSGQIELYPDDIAKFTIWQAPDAVQATIRSHIEDSFKAKADAAHLLEGAKRAVEIAIEQDEQSAMQWLQDQTSEGL